MTEGAVLQEFGFCIAHLPTWSQSQGEPGRTRRATDEAACILAADGPQGGAGPICWPTSRALALVNSRREMVRHALIYFSPCPRRRGARGR